MKFRVVALLCSTGALFAQEPQVMQEARRALSEDIPQVAIAKLRSVLDKASFPASSRTPALRLLAEAQAAAGEPEEALATLQKAQPPADPDALLLHARVEVSAGRWADALKRYQSLLREPKARVEAILGQAECLQALSRTDEAAATLQQLQASGRAPTTGQLRLASLYAELGNAPKARKTLDAVKAETVSDRKWQQYLEARLLLLEGNPRAALPALEHLLSDKVGLSANLAAAATLAVAEAQRLLSGPDPAAKTLVSFIRQYPNSPQLELVFRRLDQIYEEDKNPPESPLHGIFADLPPRASALGQFYVTRLQMRAGRYERAQMSLDSFMKKFPRHELMPYAYQIQAKLHFEANNTAEEVRALESALKLATTEELRAEIALSTALVNLRQGDFARAATRLKQAAASPRLKQSAAYNAALGWLWQQNYERFRQELASFATQFQAPALIAQLRLEEGLVQARHGHPAAASTLQTFVREFPDNPRRGEAQIAMAELAFQQDRDKDAEILLVAAKEPPTTPQNQEQADYLAVFLADKKKPRDSGEVIRLAKEFIARYPESVLLADVRMKLGQVYFAEDDYLHAQEQFETVATISQRAASGAALSPEDASRREVALFLAGQCGMKMINTEALNHALELFDKVAERKGTFEFHARLQQAMIKKSLGSEDDAVKIYDSIIGAPAGIDPELRFAALIGKGDNLVALAQETSESATTIKEKALRDAIQTYDILLKHPEVGALWRNQAAYKKGKALQQLGLIDDALTVFYDVLARNAAEPQARETFWYAKAGFDAAGILESREQWKNAVSVYERMAALPGAHAAQAKQRVTTLRLQHFLWE